MIYVTAGDIDNSRNHKKNANYLHLEVTIVPGCTFSIIFLPAASKNAKYVLIKYLLAGCPVGRGVGGTNPDAPLLICTYF